MSMRITAPLQATHFKDQAQRPLETLLMGFRTCYLKIWHLGIMTILSWRTLRKHAQERTLWPPSSSLKQVMRPSYKRSVLTSEDRGLKMNPNRPCLSTGPCSQQVVDYLCSTICLLVSFSPPDFLLFIKPRIKTLKLACLGIFIPFWRILCHAKLTLSKFVCISLANLSSGPVYRARTGN